MANSGSPVGVPVLGRLALVLAAIAPVIVACGSGETTPPAVPAVPAAPATSTTEATPAAPPEPQDAPGSEPDGGTRAEPADETTDGSGTTAAAPAAGSAESDTGSVDGVAEPPAPAGLSPEMEARLVALLDELAGIAGAWDPSGRASLAVVSADGTLYGFNERRQHISASAVKPLWTAAAIDLAGLAAVEVLAPAALVHSDNLAAGGIIDLIGIDAVNSWGTDVAGTTGTHLAAWHFGTDRVAQSVIDGGSRANLTTVGDLALFYARLQRGELLDTEGVAALEEWLRATDRGALASGAVTGALLARLPDRVAGAAIHKAGWLPPYCCRAEVRLVIDAGVIPLPGGSWFAIAAVSDRGDFYNLSVRWVSLAACRTYALLADDPDHNCDRSGDGVPRPDLWGPPPEPGLRVLETEDPESGDPQPTDGSADAVEIDDADSPGTETPPATTEPEPQDVEEAAEPEESPPGTGEGDPPAGGESSG